MDFHRLHEFTEALSFFIIRARSNLQFRRLYSQPVHKAARLRYDQTGRHSFSHYPHHLRRINYYVLVAIIKKRLHCHASLYTILQIPSLSLFEKIPLNQLLTQPMPPPPS